MRSGCCHWWFGKQPERWSGRSANGARVGRRVRIERKRKGETPLSVGAQWELRRALARRNQRSAWLACPERRPRPPPSGVALFSATERVSRNRFHPMRIVF
jgi:hypothetical protein